jgi:hypothetical protein
MLLHAHRNSFNQFRYKLPNYTMKLTAPGQTKPTDHILIKIELWQLIHCFVTAFFSLPFWDFICSFHIESDGWLDCARRNGTSRDSITSSIVPWKVNHHSAWKLSVTADFILHRFPKHKLKMNILFPSIFLYPNYLGKHIFSKIISQHSVTQACRNINYFCYSKLKICWWKYAYDTVLICDTEKARRQMEKILNLWALNL